MGIDKRPQDQGGWSLVELTITLTLIGLLAALALPAFVQWGDRLERKQFLSLLAEDLRMAQRKAQALETEISLSVSRDGQHYSVWIGNRCLQKEMVPSGMRLQSNYPSGRIVFRRSGQARGGTFYLIDGEEKVGRVVVQVASGRPRVEVVP